MDRFPVQSMAQLSLHLKSLRKTRGMTQAELAKLLGVTQGRYAQIERNPEVISIAQFFAILTALRTDVELKLRSEKATTASQPARTEDPTKPPRKAEDW
jgi:HTH-type transcriptional regulator / antitoxin HipB